MLHYIRESIQGWIAWAIVIMLIIPFALWGINSYFDEGGALTIASVNGEEISQQSYQQAYYLQRDRMQQMLGGQYDPGMFDKRIKQQALDDLIQRELLFQNAEALGYRVAEQSVITTIQNIEAFQEDGKFSKDLYTRQLSAQGESPAGFEQRMHRAILTQQLYTGIASSAMVTSNELDTILMLQEQSRDVDYVMLAVADYKQESDASEDAIEAYYNSNLDQYKTTQKVSIEYIELAANQLTIDTEPDEEELKQFYESRLEQFRADEQRRTRHILIEIGPDAKDETIKSALAKAADLKTRIDNGENFEDLAREFSDDPGSASKGGDLGFFGRGFMDQNFEKAMFTLQEGEVSEPVLSAFGYHIIKLEGIKGGTTKSFEEVRQSLEQEFKDTAAERKYFEESEKLTNLAYEVPDTLTDAAGSIGAEIKTTELFDRNSGTGIASNPKVRAAAFSEEVLVNKYNSEPIEIGENHVVVLRIKDNQEPSQRPLAEVKDQITKQIIADKARDRVMAKGTELLKELSEAQDADAVVSKLDKNWIKSGELKRNDTKIDKAIVKKAFKLTAPKEGRVSYGGETLASGDFAVIRLNKVADIDLSVVDEAKKTSLKRNLSGLHGEAEFNNLLSSLKEESRIVIKEDNL